MAQLATRTKVVAGGIRRYRWKELSLLIIPSCILLLAMTQLLLVQNLDLGTILLSGAGAIPGAERRQGAP